MRLNFFSSYIPKFLAAPPRAWNLILESFLTSRCLILDAKENPNPVHDEIVGTSSIF